MNFHDKLTALTGGEFIETGRRIVFEDERFTFFERVRLWLRQVFTAPPKTWSRQVLIEKDDWRYHSAPFAETLNKGPSYRTLDRRAPVYNDYDPSMRFD